ncbi:unnamed protein product [Somion occarium]|uniref:Amine oxidase domain-containing protein n=1 Tax=Somion occarium TaxID=3059160 RepID=A0ABP1CR89_9APHY
MPRIVKVAVVGSGLAGLTAAYRLSKSAYRGNVEFEVHLFEKTSSLGMDSHSVSLDLPGYDGEYRVDVPMRSFQGGYYPQLIALYKHLGVQFRTADFSYSFSTLYSSGPRPRGDSMETTMIYNGASGRDGVGIPSSLFPSKELKAEGILIEFLATARGYLLYFFSTVILLLFYLRILLFSLPLRVNIPPTTELPIFRIRISLPQTSVVRLLAKTTIRPAPNTTLHSWMQYTTPTSPLAQLLGLDRQWRIFIINVIVPLFSAVCTASEEHIWNMPVEEILDYVWLTFGTHHYLVINGVRDVARRMVAYLPQENIHLSSPILSLTRSDTEDESVDVRCTNGKVYTGFSHVIFATQANHATALLETYLDSCPNSPPLDSHRKAVQDQIDCLSQFTYCKTIVINHTDNSLLPPNPNDRRDLNLVRMIVEPICTLGTSDSIPAPLSSSPTPLPSDKTSDSEELGDLCLPPTYTMATHILPPPHTKQPQSKSSSSNPKLPILPTQTRVYQTTNPIIPPQPETILSVAKMERAIVNVKGKSALRSLWQESWDSSPSNHTISGKTWKWGCAGQDGGLLGPLQGAGRLTSDGGGRSENEKKVPGLWICGSYAHCGIPLLEGCVVSGRNVVEQGVWVSEGVGVVRGEERLW